MAILLACVLLISWAVHLTVNQSALLVLNVQVIWLVLAKNVEILVQDRVELLLNVMFSITYPPVPVTKDTLEIHLQAASLVHLHVIFLFITTIFSMKMCMLMVDHKNQTKFSMMPCLNKFYHHEHRS